MLVNKKVIIKWSGKNKWYYTEKGYIFTKDKENLEVDVTDLPLYSRIKIDVECDYCGEIFKESFDNYNHIKKNFNKDCCYDCKYIKHKETECIKKGLNEEETYKIISEYKNANYYKDINNFKFELEKLINKLNRIPSKNEIHKTLHVTSKILDKHGDLKDIIESMGYGQLYKLVDSSGYQNKSIYEFQIAEFLIKNSIIFTREDYPFPETEKRYQSDFCFHLKNGENIYCEMWGYDGYSKNLKKDSREYKYKEKMELKIQLYKKYGLKLISISSRELENRTLDQIQNILLNKFKDIFNKELVKVNNKFLINQDSVSDDELLEQLLRFSDNDNKLPTETLLEKNNAVALVRAIRKRYGSYNVFALKYNKNISQKMNYWNENIVLEKFNYYLKKYKELPTIKGINNHRQEDINLSGLLSYISNNGGMKKYRNKFIKNFCLNNLYIFENKPYLQDIINEKISPKGKIFDEINIILSSNN